MQTEIRCVKLINNVKWANLIVTLHWTTVLLNLHVQTCLIYAKSLTESGPCPVWSTGVGCVCVSVAENMGVCLFHFTQGSWVCASLYRRTANMSQRWGLKPGYRLQGSKFVNTWILGSRFQNLEINNKITITNKREVAHIPTRLTSSWPTWGKCEIVIVSSDRRAQSVT